MRRDGLLSDGHPRWCDRERCHEPDPPDRFHEHRGPLLPGVTRVAHRDEDGEARASAENCEIGLTVFSSATHRDDTWVAIDLGEHGPGLTLTVGSMRRVMPVLVDLLYQVGL